MKQTQQHTPGPWMVDATPAHRPCSFIVRHKASRCAAWVPLATCHTTADGDTAANARLIAAAPELLEACKFALDWLGRISATSNGKDIMLANAPNGQHRNMGELRAAIAGAEHPRLTQPQPTKEN